jgi:polyisoprenoid-binding protein YceI
MNVRLLGPALTVLACLMAPTTAAAAPEMYAVDPTHTSIVFSVSHMSLSYTYGFFRKVAGEYILDKADPAACRFRFAIQTDSLDTNLPDRDNHLKSPDFFNVQEFPTITFESTSCAKANTPDGSIVYNVTGNLTIHGVTQKVTLPVRMLGEGQGAFKDQRTGFLSNVTIKRSDFGMTNRLDMVGDAVAVTISFEGVRQDGAGAPPARPATR